MITVGRTMPLTPEQFIEALEQKNQKELASTPLTEVFFQIAHGSNDELNLFLERLTNLGFPLMKIGQSIVSANLIPSAIAANDRERLGILLRYVAVNRRFGRLGESPLCQAVKRNSENIQMIEFLLKQGANPYIPNNLGDTAIEIAKNKRYNTSVKLLEACRIQEDVSLKHLNERVQRVKNFGHIEGISASIKIQSDLTSFNLNTEGHSTYPSILMLNKQIKEYIERLGMHLEKDKEFNDSILLQGDLQEILNAFQAQILYLECRKTNAEGARELSERYHKRNLTIVPCTCQLGGSAEHDFSVALYGNYLIVCNREIPLHAMGGTVIYKLDPNKVTGERIEQFKRQGRPLVLTELKKIIDEMVDISEPPIRLPSKKQKHGTCTFVNAKGVVEGILYVKHKERLLENKRRNERTEGVGVLNAEQLENEAKDFAERGYKKFTRFMRDNFLQQEISEFRSLAKNLMELENTLKEDRDEEEREKILIQREEHDIDRKIYYDLFLHTILAHHGQEKPMGAEYARKVKRDIKIPDELQREEMILEALDPLTRTKMITEIENRQGSISLLYPAIKNGRTTLSKMLLESNASLKIALEEARSRNDWIVVAKLEGLIPPTMQIERWSEGRTP